MRLSRQFQACLFIYLFIYFHEKVVSVKKAPKPKTNDFHPLRRELIFACECFFYAQNLFINKQS